MNDDATQVIKKYKRMALKDNLFDRFYKACEKAKNPNKALVDALAFTEERRKEQVFLC